jgi:hypothetical protein
MEVMKNYKSFEEVQSDTGAACRASDVSRTQYRYGIWQWVSEY